MLEIRQLIYFKTVAEHLNFTNAAKSLNMSQPPLSKQIKQLEDFLDVSLFYRTNRSVKLTEAGTYFYKATLRLLNNIDNHVETVKKIGSGQIGNIRIGFSGSVVYDILPTIIQHIHSVYPDLKLSVLQLPTSQQINALNNGELDVGILVPPIHDETINTLPIRKEEFIVCLHRNHPLAKMQEPIDVSLFNKDSIIMTPPSTGSGYYGSVMELCKAGGFSPIITQKAQEQHTIVSLVASEIGTAFVPLSTSKIHQENVVYKKLKQKVYKETALAWNIGDPTPVVQLFLSTITQKNFYDSNGN